MVGTRYILPMLKQWSARSLFIFVRTHRHLEYYLKLQNARVAANQNGIVGRAGASDNSTNVIEIHPLVRVRF
jgi:hypothetical protein